MSDSERCPFVALDESQESSDGEDPTELVGGPDASPFSANGTMSSASPKIRHTSFNSTSSAPLPFAKLPFLKKATRQSSFSTLETESVSMSSYSRSSAGSGSRRSTIESNPSSSRRASGGSLEVADVVRSVARRASERDSPEDGPGHAACDGRDAARAEPVRERSSRSRSRTAKRVTEEVEEDAGSDPPRRSGRSRSRTTKREPTGEDAEDNTEPAKASERTSRSGTMSKREKRVSRSRSIAAAVRNIRSSRSRSRSRARDKSQGRDRSRSRARDKSQGRDRSSSRIIRITVNAA